MAAADSTAMAPPGRSRPRQRRRPSLTSIAVSEQDSCARRSSTATCLLVLLAFFGAGLLLAFTPCVLPMVPILSGIIAGGGENVSTRRAFSLSVAYVLGMAVTYTVAGVAVGAAASNPDLVPAAVDHRPVCRCSLLAASMFGFFTLQMPRLIQSRLAMSNQQQAGTYHRHGVMGALSALIVTACVAPPLIAALAVIGQTGNVLRGGAALFAMSLGMGMPLLVVGASAGTVAAERRRVDGHGEETVRRADARRGGLDAVRILPGRVTLRALGRARFVLAWLLWRGGASRGGARIGLRARSRRRRGSTVWCCWSARARAAPIRWRRFRSRGPAPHASTFKRIKTLADLEREVAAADGRWQARDARLLCRLVRVVQGDGEVTFPDADVRAALAQRGAAAGRRHRER